MGLSANANDHENSTRDILAENRSLRAARDINTKRIEHLRDELQKHEFQRLVREFMRKMDQRTPDCPTLLGYPAHLRAALILEEAHEFVRASGLAVAVGSGDHGHESTVSQVCPQRAPDILGMVDALCDLIYVAFGAAVALGVDLEPFFAEVHRANMEKAGGPVREDGKRLKPEGWRPPNLLPILHEQLGAYVLNPDE